MRIRASLLMTTVVCGTPSLACAQSDAPGGAQPPAAPGPSRPLLSGPEADERTQATIVRVGLDGRLVEPEVSPEEAALALLMLTERERADTEAILSERAAIIDGVVRTNVLVLVEASTARSAGDAEGLRRAYEKIVPGLMPLRARGPLRQEIAGALEPANRGRFRALLDEYWMATYRQAEADAQDRGASMSRRAFMEQIVREAAERELRRSYDRVVVQRVAEFEALMRDLALPPENEARVRTMVMELGERAALDPSPEEKRDLFVRIWRELDSGERARLLEVLRGDGAE